LTDNSVDTYFLGVPGILPQRSKVVNCFLWVKNNDNTGNSCIIVFLYLLFYIHFLLFQYWLPCISRL